MCFGADSDANLTSDLNDFGLKLRATNSEFRELSEVILNASDSEAFRQVSESSDLRAGLRGYRVDSEHRHSQEQQVPSTTYWQVLAFQPLLISKVTHESVACCAVHNCKVHMYSCAPFTAVRQLCVVDSIHMCNCNPSPTTIAAQQPLQSKSATGLAPFRSCIRLAGAHAYS